MDALNPPGLPALALALVFTLSGALKAVGRKPWLIRTGQTGLTHIPVWFIRLIAVSELLGAAGLVLPGLVGVGGFLRPIAAACLAVLMAGAAVVHLQLAREDAQRRHRELVNMTIPLSLLALCLWVAHSPTP